MLLWFVGAAVFAIASVFRDPAFDYRPLILGVLLPDVIDSLLRLATMIQPLHSVLVAVAVLVAVMVATIGRRTRRRRWLGVPIGLFVHLVVGGTFGRTEVFWWPLGGWNVSDTAVPVLERGWFTIPLEVVGVGLCLWLWRRYRLSDQEVRTEFVRTGRLVEPVASVPAHRPRR